VPAWADLGRQVDGEDALAGAHVCVFGVGVREDGAVGAAALEQALRVAVACCRRGGAAGDCAPVEWMTRPGLGRFRG
jgi:hypothetical protein